MDTVEDSLKGLPEIRKKLNYAFKDEDEFFSEGSRSDLQAIMLATTLPEEYAERFGLREKGSTVWDAFRSVIKRLWEKLFGKMPSNSVLDAYFKIAEAIEEANKQIPEMQGKAGPKAMEEQPELPGTRRMEDTPAFGKGSLTIRGLMNETQRQRYERKITQQQEEDKAWQQERVTREIRKRQSKEWKERAEELRPEVEKDIRERPDVAADTLLRKGEYGGEKIKGGVKLDSEKLTPAQKQALPERYHKKGGMNPDDIAGLFGYQTGDDLVSSVAAIEKQRQASGKVGEAFIKHLVDSALDERLEKELGNFDENILAEAQEHVLSPTQIDILHEELVALGEHAGSQIPLQPGDLQRWVKEEFDKAPISAHDTDKYLAQAGRAGRAVEDALLKQDFTEAYKQKQRQLISLLQANQAKRLKKETDRFAATAKTYSKREVANTQQQYTNFIHQILGQVGQMVRRSVQDLQEAIANSDYSDLESFVDAKEADLRELPIADFLYDPAWKKPLAQLSVEEFRAVHDSIKALVKNGKDELKIYKQGEARDLAKVKGEMVEQLKELGGKPADVSGPPRKGFKHAIRTAWASLLQMEALFNRWDKGDPNGIFSQYIMMPLARASNEKAALERKYARRLKDLADKKADLDKRVPNNIFYDPNTFDPETFKRTSDSELLTLTRKNLRAILQNVGNQENLNKLARGYDVDPAEIYAWLYQHARKSDWDWAQRQGRIFADIKRESDRMYRRLTDSAPENIELRPVWTPHGTYDGWYHPVVYDPRFPGSSRKLMGGDVLEEDNYVRATTPAGYTKRRTGYAGPVSLDLDATPERMRGMLHDIAFREAVIQASKIFYDRSVRSAVIRHYGQPYADLMIPYLRDVANSANFRSDAQAVGARVSEFMRQNIIGTLIGFNPGTVAKHFQTAAVNSLTEVGPINFLRAVKDLLSTNDRTGERNWNFAMTTSEELQRRHRNYMETLGGAQQNVLGQTSLRDFILKAGATPVAISDLLSAVPTWLAQYRKSMEEGLTHGASIERADRAIRRAHGSTAITNRPAAMRGGQLAQWLTSLYGFFSHMLNRQFEMAWQASDAFKGVKKGDLTDLNKYKGQLVAGFFSYIILPALIEEAVTPLTNDEHESWAAWGAKTLAKGISSSWPVIRDLADFALSGQRREPSAGLLTASYKAVSDAARDLGKPNQMFTKQHAGQTIQHLMVATGALTGLTNAEEGKAARFIYNYASGQEHPRGIPAWWRGLRTGTSKELRR